MSAPKGTSGPTTATVPLDRIYFDERLQARRLSGGTDLRVVRRYEAVLRSGNSLPPITLARLEGVLYCADGWHRAEAHGNVDRYEVEANVVDVATFAEAEWLAARGNLEHGLPLTKKDELEAFRRFIRARQHRKANGGFKTYREIAKDFGGTRTHNTIHNWIKRHYPAIYRAMGSKEFGVREDRGGEARHQVRLKGAIAKALAQARTALPGIKDPDVRGALIAEAEELLADMRGGGPWNPVNPQEYEPF